MTYLELYMFHEPLWAILCYIEICRMVCPLREWYLPSTDLFPLRTHCLLASKCLVCQSHTPGIDIHLHQHNSPAITNPKSPQCAHSSQKVLPSPNSKEIQYYISKGVWSCLLKKKWWRKRSSILHSQKSCKIWSSNKKTKFHPSVSPFPSSLLDILPSIRSEFG